MAHKWQDTAFKGALVRARGLGAAHHGAEHWIAQRLSSFALIPLSLWMVCAILSLRGADYTMVADWMQQPVNAVLSVLFIVMSFWHAAQGLQVVIEDYIHAEGVKIVMLWSINLALLGLGLASTFAVLKVAL
ncbi:MAG: succinate dehydrogenase, hydrophobic membrane anchor protein [Pseudomonadota bacterium]